MTRFREKRSLETLPSRLSLSTISKNDYGTRCRRVCARLLFHQADPVLREKTITRRGRGRTRCHRWHDRKFASHVRVRRGMESRTSGEFTAVRVLIRFPFIGRRPRTRVVTNVRGPIANNRQFRTCNQLRQCIRGDCVPCFSCAAVTGQT